MLKYPFKISKEIVQKLEQKHHVVVAEIWECFLNRSKGLLEDTRLHHKTEPPSLWFIAETDHERLLKVVFIEHYDGTYEIKTAYEPNNEEVRIYEKFA